MYFPSEAEDCIAVESVMADELEVSAAKKREAWRRCWKPMLDHSLETIAPFSDNIRELACVNGLRSKGHTLTGTARDCRRDSNLIRVPRGSIGSTTVMPAST